MTKLVRYSFKYLTILVNIYNYRVIARLGLNSEPGTVQVAKIGILLASLIAGPAGYCLATAALKTLAAVLAGAGGVTGRQVRDFSYQPSVQTGEFDP